MPPRTVRRILLVSLDNLGDLVFASALAPPLRARYPDARITLLCKRYTADVAELVPDVDTVVAAEPFWDRAPGGEKGSFREFVRVVRQLRRERFDVAVLAAAPWRTAAAVWLMGIPMRIGLARKRAHRFLTHALPADDRGRPVLEEHARVLAPLGITPSPLRYRLTRGPLAERRERMAPALGELPVVALHPFASKRDRCVPIREWVFVARALEVEGMSVLWIGSAPELAQLRATEPDDAWHHVDQLGDGSLADTAAALSLASLFIGHDSGPLHVAGALGIPCVGVFAPGEPARTFPQGVGPSRVVAAPSPSAIPAELLLAAAREMQPPSGWPRA